MSRHRRALSAGLALVVAFTGVVSFGTATTSPAQAATNTADSSVVLQGKGEFAGLKVRVAQTRNLITQVVPITWSGGKPTAPTGAFGSNYLSIMQCWADAATGPTREQCQFGAFYFDNRGGFRSSSRQVDGTPADPDETIESPGPGKNAIVPFRSFDGEKCLTETCDMYDQYTSNEVPYAATRADGTGQEYFNVQTVADAPGLGCGQPVTVRGVTKGRSCWLVIVPRGATEVDGSALANANERLNSSPLSVTNWAHRMQVELEFEPTGRTCPLGKAERRTVGQEIASEAVLRWQPALCAGDGAVYGYSQVPDDSARRKLQSSDPGLVYLGYPLTKAENRAGVSVTYAPVAIAGLTIGLVVDSQSPLRAPAEVKKRDGLRMTGMNLTPRLVAKLITSSYARSVHVTAPSVKDNPTDMTRDPEFQKYNPAWANLNPSLHDLQLPLGRSDAAHQVWSWLLGDPEARAFLRGEPDPWGMKVNPNGRITAPRYDYPKNDPYCFQSTTIGAPPQCMLDMHPYQPDMHEAARSISRGDTLTKTWDPIAQPPAWKKDVPAYSGRRVGLALLDTASAARYSVTTASIRNASGAFVRPTASNLVATTRVMKQSAVKGVLSPAPRAKGANVYPLTTVSYAATVPAALDEGARADYADLLRYAAGKGQVQGPLPGQLPAGYAPLTAQMRKQTRAAAAAVLAGAPSSGDRDDPESGRGTRPTSGTANGPAGVTSADAAGGSGPGSGPVGGAVAVASRTPGVSSTALRWIPLLALGLGVLAAFAGPVMIAAGRRRTLT